MNPDTCRIREDVEISEPEKKKLRIQKYPDACVRAASSYINTRLNSRSVPILGTSPA